MSGWLYQSPNQAFLIKSSTLPHQATSDVTANPPSHLSKNPSDQEWVNGSPSLLALVTRSRIEQWAAQKSALLA